MRIDLRVAEHLVDAFDHPLGDRVLELVGLVVDLRPVEAEHPHQEELDQTMPPYDVDREMSSRIGEAHAAVGLVLDQTAIGQRLDHRGDRARRDPERVRQCPRGDAMARVALLLEQDLLEVVLHGRGRHGKPTLLQFSTHGR